MMAVFKNDLILNTAVDFNLISMNVRNIRHFEL